MSTAALPPVATKIQSAADLPNKKRAKHHSRSSSSELLDEATPSSMHRSISTPSMASAAMVTSEQQALFEKQRQSQIMMTTYLSNAIKEKKMPTEGPLLKLLGAARVQPALILWKVYGDTRGCPGDAGKPVVA
ncbi:hypothetical protein BGW42_002849 [Actinomortierella wolfii]|nr:hypothetical protein BGW42_002849 [Actinomortierella wolfii]